jgi:hypothetical protein
MTLWQIMFLSEFIPACLRNADVGKVKELCDEFIQQVAQKDYRDCDVVSALIALLTGLYSTAVQSSLPEDNVERRIVEAFEMFEMKEE